MAIQSYFFNAVLDGGVYDRTYNAEDVTSYLDLLVGNGVFPNPSSQLKVRASSGMNVIVGAGSGWINGYKLVNTADLVVAISASDVLLNRIDRVVFFVDWTSRTMGITVKTGTLAESPSAPSLTRTSSRYEMALADITVNKQTSAITTSMIKDRRGNSSLCGYVQGLIQQVDTTDLWEQQQAQFDTWLATIQDQFRQAKAFRKREGVIVTRMNNYGGFNVTDVVPSFSYVYDVLDIYINGIHLNSNEYTLTNNVVVFERAIEKSGAVITVDVYQAYDPDAE